MRVSELGDNFKERLAGGGGGKAPAKGKVVVAVLSGTL